MPKGIYPRERLRGEPTAHEMRMDIERLEERVKALEARIATMNEYFERGYLPPNVQSAG